MKPLPGWPEPWVETKDTPSSDASITVLSGPALTAWSDSGTDTEPSGEVVVRLGPGRAAVVGRSDGHDVPYLDPAYRPTTVVPGTHQCVLHSGGRGTDNYVSRGHFTLRGIPGGLLFLNGVPRRGGGVRPPYNWTLLLAPQRRLMAPAEEYRIDRDSSILIELPNGSQVRIGAV
jgi:hypothetical protein